MDIPKEKALSPERLVNLAKQPVPVFGTNEVYREVTEHGVTELLRDMSAAIDRALATGAGDLSAIPFEFWKKPTSQARKKKPVELIAELFKHPQYEAPWIRVSHKG